MLQEQSEIYGETLYRLECNVKFELFIITFFFIFVSFPLFSVEVTGEWCILLYILFLAMYFFSLRPLIKNNKSCITLTTKGIKFYYDYECGFIDWKNISSCHVTCADTLGTKEGFYIKGYFIILPSNVCLDITHTLSQDNIDEFINKINYAYNRAMNCDNVNIVRTYKSTDEQYKKCKLETAGEFVHNIGTLTPVRLRLKKISKDLPFIIWSLLYLYFTSIE